MAWSNGRRPTSAALRLVEPMRPILLFDVMGTLVHDPFFEEMPEFFGLSFDELLAVKHPSAWVEFEPRMKARTSSLSWGRRP